jgi:hypothetical protein
MKKTLNVDGTKSTQTEMMYSLTMFWRVWELLMIWTIFYLYLHLPRMYPITYTILYDNRNTTSVKNGIQWTIFNQLEDLDIADNLAEVSITQR